MGDDVSILSLLGRLVFSLGIVLILMALLARVLRGKFGGATARKGAARARIEIVARQGLGRNASVTVVRSGDKLLTLGVTEQHVHLLSEQDAPPEEVALESPDGGAEAGRAGVPARITGSPWTATFGGGSAPSPTWRELMERLRDRTARRS